MESLSRVPSVPSVPERLRRLTVIIVAVASMLASLLVLSPFVESSDAQAISPIACDGTPYIMQNGRMYEVLPSPDTPGEFIFNQVGQSGITYGNSLAYDPVTNVLLGTRKLGGVWEVQTYDATFGVVRSLPIFSAAGSPDWPQGSTNYAGTALGDGRYIITTFARNGSGTINGNNTNLWSIDPTTGEATFIASVIPLGPRLADFSYNPADGYLYHAQGGNLIRINPLSGAKTNMGAVGGAMPSGSFGSSYFDAAGNLYVHKNGTGELTQISGIGTGTYTATLVATTPTVRGADAASCIGEIDLIKDVVDDAGDSVPLADRVYAPGDTVRYEFTIINNALPAGPQELTLCDTLPADGRTYTGAFSSVTSVSFSPPLAAGDTSFCASVTAPSSLWVDPSQPGGDPVSVIIEVELGDDMIPGEYENQATLENPFQPGNLVSSDDPGDLSDPEDPTTIEVTGAFTVTKTVANHPDGNGTDTFTVAIECTDRDGLPFDVDPTSIVDADGIPWSDATLNSFPITDGDEVRVIDLPAGATCTAVESPVPAAYALTVVSSDDTVDDGGSILIDEAPSQERVDLTNRTGTFSLTKLTEPPLDRPAAELDLRDEFIIDVTCTRSDGATVVLPTTSFTVDASIPAGAGASGTTAYPDTPLLPEGTICVATEQSVTGWTDLTGEVKFEITADANTDASITNRRELADLDVTKTITGLEPVDNPDDFAFEISVECRGGFSEEAVRFGPFPLETDLAVNLPGLPVGTTCVVVEAATIPFAPAYTPAGGLITIADGDNRVGIENIAGTFVIEKNTVIPTDPYSIIETGDFDFDVVCTNEGDTLTDSTYTVEVTDTAPAAGAVGGITYEVLPLLPPGSTCTITEIVPAGWKLTSAPSVDIEIPFDGERPTASFTNERILGDLTITKTVNGLPAAIDASTIDFAITATCTGPFTNSPIELSGTVTDTANLVFPSLPAGTDCTIVEDPDPRFVTTEATLLASIDSDAGATVEFVNTTSSLEVTKTTVTPGSLPIEPDAAFSIALVCTRDDIEVASMTLDATTTDGQALIASPTTPLLAPGTECELTETVPADWIVTTNPQTVTIGAEPASVAFENTRRVGRLEISKDMAGLPAGLDPDDYSFTVDVTCTGDFKTADGTWSVDDLSLSTVTSATVENLPTGAVCTIIEDASPGFVASYPDGTSVTIPEGTAELSVLNTTSSFELDKTTITPAGVQDDDAFDFAWTCDNASATTGSLTVTTVAGAGTATAVDGLPLVEPGTTCTVTETPNAKWTVNEAVVSVTTSAAGPIVASFVNTRVVEDLTIDKAIVGLPGGDPTSFTFLIDVECTGDFEPGPFVQTGLAIKVGEPVVIPDLPTEATCTVLEQEDPAWTPIYDPTGGEITITDGADNRVEIVNSTGTLIVFKEAVVAQTHPIDPVADFDFRIVCQTAAGVENANLVSSLTTDAITATGAAGGITYDSLGLLLEPGTTCEITELGPDAGWTRTSDETITLTISAGGAPTAAFTNERDLGQIQISKVVEGLPASLSASSFDFLVTATCNGGGLPTDYEVGPIALTGGTSVTIADLPSGATCTVEEAADGRFTPTYSATALGVTKDTTTPVTITNTTRTLAITKTATVDSAQPIPLDVDFTFEIDCSNGFATTVTVTTAADGTGSIAHPDLPLLADGTTCAVEEVGLPDGWVVTGDPSQSTTLTEDRTVAFTNERSTADLTVNKAITGLPSGLVEADYAFTVDIVCTGDFVGGSISFDDQALATDSPVTIADLPTGANCTIAEDPATGFTTTYPAGSNVELTADATLTIDNATSTFAITKTTSAPLGVIADATFTFTWSCADPTSATGSALIATTGGSGTWTHTDGLPLLPPGTECSVTETDIPTGWSVANSTIDITTITDAPAVAAFTNTRDTGTLTITKEIVGQDVPDPALDDEPFTVTVTCAGDFDSSPLTIVDTVTVNAPIALTDLPTGAICGIEEAADPRFTPVYDTASVTIDAGDNDARIINATGRFIVMKQAVTTSDRPIDLIADFEFSIVCTGLDGSTVFDETRTLTTDIFTADGNTGGIGYETLPLLAEGTVCEIEEQPLDGWTILTDPNPTTVTIDAATPATAAFVNQRDLGSIDVSKIVVGLPETLDADAFDFLITATCNGGGLPTDYEVGPIVLSGDSTVSIADLPTGATCSVVETDDNRFAPTYSETELAITKDIAAPLTITNTTRTLTVTKTASTTSLLPIELSHDFTFAIDCSNGYSTTATITTDAAGAGTLAHPELPLLANGTTCTVEETDLPAGWQIAGDAVQSAELTENRTVAFTNERDIADLAVSKTIAGLHSGLVAADFTFTVDVDCTGDFIGGTYQVSNAQIATDAPIAIAGVPTGAECTIDEDTAAGFTTTYPDGTDVTVPDGGASLSITNTTSTFAITKTTVAPAGVVEDATFAFDWSCDNPGADNGTASLTTVAGSASFDHADGLPLLEPGTICTVDEATIPTGWTAAEPTIEVTTDAAGPVTAAFVNTRDTGSLTIAKSILGEPTDPGPDLDDELFDITVTCTGAFDLSPLVIETTVTVNDDRVIDDLPTGAECSVVEAIDPRFTPTYSPGTVTIVSGSNGLGIVNATGELIVSKETIAPTTHPIDPTGTFTFSIVCTSPAGAVIFDEIRPVDATMLTATGAMGGIRYDQLPLLAAGTSCTITEIDPGSEWNNLTPDPVTVEIGSDAPRTAAFANQRTTGSVSVAKLIEGLPVDIDPAAYSFEATLTCNHDDLPTDYQVVVTIATDSPAMIDDLPTGATCAAVETADDRFDPTVSADVVVATEPQTITITNTTRTLTIVKDASANSALPINLAAVFMFSIDCTNGFSETVAITTNADGDGSTGYPLIPLLPNGADCTATELTPPTGWSIAGDATQSVDLAADRTLTFANTRDVAAMSVTKRIEGLPTGVDPTTFEFTVDIACTGDFIGGTYTLDDAALVVGSAAVLADVPTGADCAVNEAPSNQFLASYPDGTSAIVTDDGASIEIINATSTFAISKSTVAPAGVIADETFTFAWSCTDPTLSSGTATITTVNGAGTWTSADGLPLVPPGTRCTVDETELPEGWTVATTPVEITTTSASPATAAFTNTREVGTLTVSKSIVGEDPASDLGDEPFTVTVTCVGDFADSPLVSTLTISENASAQIADLPTGAECSIVEAADVRFTPAYDPQSLVIAAGSNTATVVNNTGRFVIMKESIVASEHPIDPIASFDFQITCTGANGVEVYSDVLTLDADLRTAQGAIGGIGYESLPLLADGTICTIEEQPRVGWEILTDPNPATITIDSADPATAAFTNARELSDLRITKTIEGLPADLDSASFTFAVTVTCSGGGLPDDYQVGPLDITVDAAAVVSDLPTDATCTVDEAADGRFTPTLPEPVTVTTEDASVEVVNTTSTLAITKTATASDPTINLVDDFDFTVECADGSTAALTISTTADGLGSASHLDGLPLVPPGTVCEVAEAATTGWSVTTTNPLSVITGADAIVSADVINTRDVNNLEIAKDVVGRPDGHPGGETWTVDIECTGDFATGTRSFADVSLSEASPILITDLPTGADCQVVEDPSAGFTPTTSPADGIVTIGASPALVEVTNTTSTFQITKTTSAPAGVIDDATFEFAWSCDDAASSSGAATIATSDGSGAWTWADGLPLLEPGTICDVDETALPDGWTATDDSLQVTTDADAIASADFVNTRTTASLNVSKTILGLLPAEDPDGFDFTVDITCAGDFDSSPLVLLDQPLSTDGWITVEDLPTGSVCTVVEDNDPQFAPLYGPADGTVTIEDDGGAVAVTNLTGRVSLVKQTVVDSPHTVDPTGTFRFEVRCIGLDGVSVVFDEIVDVPVATVTAAGAIGDATDFPPLAEGTNCVVTELDENDAPGAPTGWSLTSTNGQDLTISSVPGEAVTFENTRDTADLSIAKTITGLPETLDADDFVFEVTVSCTHEDLPAVHTVGPLSVSTGGVIGVPKLPTGAICTVQEAADERFTPSYSADTVTIIDGGASIAITNATAASTVTKRTSADSALAVDLTGSFEITMTCANGVTGSVTLTTDAVGNASASTPDLPLVATGTECTFAETAPPAAWQAQTAPITIEMTTAGANVTFENERLTGDLTITKTIDGVDDGSFNDTAFPVTIECHGDFETSPITVTGTISVNTPFLLEDIPTEATCAATEAADPRFTTTSAPADATVTVDSDGASIGFTNSTGRLIVAKTTVAADDQPIDPTGSFTFNFDCVSPAGERTTFDRVANVETLVGTGAAGGIPYTSLPFLPDGSECTITELDAGPDWEALTPTSVVVTLDADNPATASFENLRRSAPLRIEKTIAGLPEGQQDAFSSVTFGVEITCTGDFTTADGVHTIVDVVSTADPIEIVNLPTGSVCEIVEDEDPRFIATYSPGTVAIGPSGAIATITNRTGELIVAKEARVSSEHPVTLEQTFTFDLGCTDPAGAAVFSGTRTVTTDLIGDGSATGGIHYDELPLLPDGTACTITEPADLQPAGWVTTSDASVDVLIDSTAPATASFVNERLVTDLVVAKKIEGLPADLDPANFSFDFTVVCNHADLPVDYTVGPFTIVGETDHRIENLPVGASCTVTEAPDPQFASSFDTETVTLEADADAVITATNTTSHFSITKTVEAPITHPIDRTATFEFSVTCSDDSTYDVALTTNPAGTGEVTHVDGLPLLPPDVTCTVIEQSDDLHTIVSPTGATSTLDQGAGDRGAVAFVNERLTSSLQVTKTVLGLPDDADPADYDFMATVTCTGGFVDDAEVIVPGRIATDTTLIVSDLPTGATCTVVEDDDPRFVSSLVPATPITIDGGDNVVAVTNRTAAFEIAKTTIVPGDSGLIADGSFEFTWSCFYLGASVGSGTVTLATVDGAAATAWPELPLLPPGSSCFVAESASELFATEAEKSAILSDDAVTTFAFENTRLVADLSIDKTIVGLADESTAGSFSFTVDVTCVGDHTPAVMTYPDLVLTTDTPIVIPDLPVGSVCTVIEDFDVRFAASYSPQGASADRGTATIVDEGTSMSIINATGRVMLVKTAGAPEGVPNLQTEATFEFAVECAAPDGTVVFDEIVPLTTDTETGNGSVGALLWENLSVVLAEGSTCTGSEVNVPDGWTAIDPSPQSVLVTRDEVVRLTFDNVADVAPVTVGVQINGLPDGIDPSQIAVTVEVTCTGPGLIDPVTIAIETAIGDPLLVPGMPLGTTCVVTTAGTPLGLFDPFAGATVITDGSEPTDVVLVADVATFTIDKAATLLEGTTGSVAAAFEFEIACGSANPFVIELVTDEAGIGTAGWPTLPLIPAGTTCTVTELATDGWLVLGEAAQSITLEVGENAPLSWANEYQLGEPIPEPEPPEPTAEPTPEPTPQPRPQRPVVVVQPPASDPGPFVSPTAPTPSPPSPTPPGALAYTGSEPFRIALSGVLLIFGGWMFLLGARRREDDE